jgi:hypothetical protein
MEAKMELEKLTEQFEGDLSGLRMRWAELGIDEDDFVKCGVCHEYFFDAKGNIIPCDCGER